MIWSEELLICGRKNEGTRTESWRTPSMAYLINTEYPCDILTEATPSSLLLRNDEVILNTQLENP